MKNLITFAIIVASGAVLFTGLPGLAQDAAMPEVEERSEEWRLARGGRIYDNWFAAQLLDPPMELHPMVPAATGVEPASSWRCSTCHGWDYRGREIGDTDSTFKPPSLQNARDADIDEIARVLRGTPHNFGPSILPDESLELVALFVSKGQHDIATFARAASGVSLGHALDGRPIYQGLCISCHDIDGRAYLEGEPEDKASLGWLSRHRPAQVLHKIRNGQPGTDMVQLRFFTDKQIADLLAYLQTLPDP